MKINVSVTAHTPLSFRVGRDARRAETLDYVPGATLLGGLANAHIQLRPNDHDEFGAFFLQDRVRYGNLYPARFGKRDSRIKAALGNTNHAVRPLPATARTCKRFSGFRFDQEDEEQHGVCDHLIAWAIFALSGETNITALEALKACPENDCDESMDTITGFYRRGSTATEYGKATVDKNLRTRTGISRRTGTVQPNILYSREVLCRGMPFWGQWTIDDKLHAVFENFLEEASEKGMIRLGKDRTRGFGKLSVDTGEIEDAVVDTADSLKTRIETFDAALRTAAQQYNVKTPHGVYVPLTTISEIILYDHLLRHQTRITGAYLADVWGLTGAELVYHSAGTRLVTGWNGLWGLPKADDSAITMGAVFLFGLPTLTDDVVNKLLRLQEEGLGARRSEGFGQLEVASSFHWEVKQT